MAQRQSSRILSTPKVVIAGLDPAIRGKADNAVSFARRVDCRVKLVIGPAEGRTRGRQ
jgi:hypothetical protein